MRIALSLTYHTVDVSVERLGTFTRLVDDLAIEFLPVEDGFQEQHMHAHDGEGVEQIKQYMFDNYCSEGHQGEEVDGECEVCGLSYDPPLTVVTSKNGAHHPSPADES